MAMSMSLRGGSLRAPAPFTSAPVRSAVSRSALRVVANKKVAKKTKIILVNDIENVGKTGEIKTVPVGYWRNFLLPNGLAKIASQSILDQLRKQKEDEIRKALEIKAEAQAFANALATIGKFNIKKKVGDKDQIYGSVALSEITDAIYQQTGRDVTSYQFTVPEIKSVGNYECTVRLHPEVLATFTVVIQKEKVAPTGAKAAPKKK